MFDMMDISVDPACPDRAGKAPGRAEKPLVPAPLARVRACRPVASVLPTGG
ncbi:hypothetical protein OCGS_2035 [Oceaniovalibus guishaninsula JLT2003]|uniref:Uncharacterized protein n=1 Tax=Oceaniovalibus guishaninsula JLT2003 TaxID=1231392 RepID=K2HMH1_9RHOB|nr:hypothetical protein OCGS_2035 [Oceaniovalibus guishaninsula JLT2003]